MYSALSFTSNYTIGKLVNRMWKHICSVKVGLIGEVINVFFLPLGTPFHKSIVSGMNVWMNVGMNDSMTAWMNRWIASQEGKRSYKLVRRWNQRCLHAVVTNRSRSWFCALLLKAKRSQPKEGSLRWLYGGLTICRLQGYLPRETDVKALLVISHSSSSDSCKETKQGKWANFARRLAWASI